MPPLQSDSPVRAHRLAIPAGQAGRGKEGVGNA